MRTPNDILLANEVEEIDLILGGHDHHCFNQLVKIINFIDKLLLNCHLISSVIICDLYLKS